MKFIFSILFSIILLYLYPQDTILLKEVTIEDYYNIIANKTEIDSVKLQRFHQQTLGDLLCKEPGIIVKNQGIGGIQTISMMGTHNQHSQVIWYGMPLNESLNGQFDYSQIKNDLHSTLSIYYGISSMLINSGAIGGLISIENKEQTNNTTHLMVRYQSLKNATYYIDNTYKHKKFITTNSLSYTQGQNNFSFINNGLLPSTICTNKTPFHSFTYQNNSILSQGKTNYTLISALSKNNRTFAPLMTSYFKSKHEENQALQNIKIIVKAKTLFKQWEIEAFTGLNTSEMEYMLQHLINNNQVSAIHSKSKEQNYYYSIIANKTITEKIEYNANLTLNQEYGHYIDLKNKTGFCKRRHQSKFNQSIKFKWNKKIRQSMLINSNYSNNLFMLLPVLISNYNLSDKIFLSYSIGLNQRIPSLNELYYLPGGNKSLVPEKSFQNDFIFKFHHTTSPTTNFTLNIKPYYNEIVNWILWTPSTFGYWEAKNIRKVKLLGNMIDIVISFTFYKKQKFDIYFNYTYQNIKGKDGEYSIKHNPYIPSHSSHANFYYSYKNFSTYIEMQYNSTRYSLSYEDNFYLAPFTLYNFGINFKTKSQPSINIDFKINNITNQFYQSIIWRPMPGRYFEISLKFNL